MQEQASDELIGKDNNVIRTFCFRNALQLFDHDLMDKRIVGVALITIDSIAANGDEPDCQYGDNSDTLPFESNASHRKILYPKKHGQQHHGAEHPIVTTVCKRCPVIFGITRDREESEEQ